MKTILVTGGDKGIGRAIVEKFAKNSDNVLFTYNVNKIGAETLMRQYKNTFAYKCDLTKPDMIEDFIKKIKKRHVAVDVLINCAATKQDAPFMKLTRKSWNDVIDVNLKSLYYITRGLAEDMLNNNWGRIVNFTSIGAFMNSYGISSYAASKAGVVGLTKSLAFEFGRKGVTVNAIAPGLIDTDLFNRIPDKIKKDLINSVPTKRVGSPEEVAELAFFLASENASYINGQVIHINGGLY